MVLSIQEYWSRLPFPPPDLPHPENEPASPALQADSLPLRPSQQSLKAGGRRLLEAGVTKESVARPESQNGSAVAGTGLLSPLLPSAPIPVPPTARTSLMSTGKGLLRGVFRLPASTEQGSSYKRKWGRAAADTSLAAPWPRGLPLSTLLTRHRVNVASAAAGGALGAGLNCRRPGRGVRDVFTCGSAVCLHRPKMSD